MTFLGFSVYRIAIGSTFCGCLGMIENSPWVTFFLNLAIISCLLTSAVRLARALSGCGLLGGLGTLWGQVSDSQRGALADAVALALCLFGWELAGNSFANAKYEITAEVVKTNHLEVGVQSSDIIVVRNKSDLPTRIVGIEKSCECVVADVVDMQILAHSRVEVPVSIVPKAEGYFRQKLFYLSIIPVSFG
jgi:hypothetical protein